MAFLLSACTPILKEGGYVGVYHQVARGETLSEIAESYGVSVEKIMKVNRMTSTEILEGQELFIPKPSRTPRTKVFSTVEGSEHSESNGTPSDSRAVLSWPLPGGKARLVSGFGKRESPFGGSREFHKGIDIDGWTGEMVHAAAAGLVVYAGSKGSYGNMVMIDHGDGIVTLYAHLSSVVVTAGKRVRAGQTIGYVGSSGLSTGSHLHFEVRVDGVATDPMRYLPN